MADLEQPKDAATGNEPHSELILPKRSMADWMIGYNVKSRYLGK